MKGGSELREISGNDMRPLEKQLVRILRRRNNPLGGKILKLTGMDRKHPALRSHAERGNGHLIGPIPASWMPRIWDGTLLVITGGSHLM